MNKYEMIRKFIEKLDALPDADLKNKKTVSDFHQRIANKIRPEIEKQDRLMAKSLSRSFTKVVR